MCIDIMIFSLVLFPKFTFLIYIKYGRERERGRERGRRGNREREKEGGRERVFNLKSLVEKRYQLIT